ncbi:hypothetical protein PHMEG_00031274 [Phytophthora megakarya]|uniref:Uncharacterized protein n=1 Tax=Phytophthora megakarya TaxID=4795 RepID=A0A225UZ06_9STRA|nr:hypothetical protein PHMEG_00031274 [Phytophthora megakarya]
MPREHVLEKARLAKRQRTEKVADDATSERLPTTLDFHRDGLRNLPVDWTTGFATFFRVVLRMESLGPIFYLAKKLFSNTTSYNGTAVLQLLYMAYMQEAVRVVMDPQSWIAGLRLINVAVRGTIAGVRDARVDVVCVADGRGGRATGELTGARGGAARAGGEADAGVGVVRTPDSCSAGVGVSCPEEGSVDIDNRGANEVNVTRVGGVGEVHHRTISPQQLPSPSIRTPRTLLTPMLEELFLKKFVAYTPAKESWMNKKTFRCVGTAYVVGRVVRRIKRPTGGRILQVLWLDTQFQNAVTNLSVVVWRPRLPNHPAWRDLTDNFVEGEFAIDTPLDELEVSAHNEQYELYDPGQLLPASLAEVEAVKSMRFEPDIQMAAPNDLFERRD